MAGPYPAGISYSGTSRYILVRICMVSGNTPWGWFPGTRYSHHGTQRDNFVRDLATTELEGTYEYDVLLFVRDPTTAVPPGTGSSHNWTKLGLFCV